MKKLLVLALTALMALSLIGCGLFADDSKVILTDDFTHTDPADLTYDQRIVLKGEGYAEMIEEYVNAAAYPNLYIMDETGMSVIGMYIYDETTGLATGWMSFADGSMTTYPAGEEIDLGKPDASLMIDIPGTVELAAIVYGNGEETLCTYFYLMLSDPAAKDTVISGAATILGFEFTEAAEGVLQYVKGEEEIAADFALEESYGTVFASKNAAAYADHLKLYYGLKVENAANPYNGFMLSYIKDLLRLADRSSLSVSKYCLARMGTLDFSL